jgi:hypothetical protein
MSMRHFCSAARRAAVKANHVSHLLDRALVDAIYAHDLQRLRAAPN